MPSRRASRQKPSSSDGGKHRPDSKQAAAEAKPQASEPAATNAAWFNYRPRRRPVALLVTATVFVAWVVFLILMIFDVRF